MKSALYLLTLLSICMVTVTSCSKNDTPQTPTPVQVDSLKKVLPTRISHTYYEDGTPASLTTDVVSIKYDTLNSKIELYSDDTTNTNPYDILEATYTYNSSGYLISYLENPAGNGFDTEAGSDYIINRAADNKINFIVESTVNDETDSTFYTYQAAGSGTNIVTSFKGYENDSLISSGTATYSFDANSRITQIQYGYGGSYTYTYNASGSVSKIVAKDFNFITSIDENYTYASGIPDGKADVLLQTLLGKDYYLPDLQYLNPFYLSVEYDFELNPPSVTDPYHVSSAYYNGTYGGQSYTDNATWMYELNEQGNVSKINFVADGDPESYSFTY